MNSARGGADAPTRPEQPAGEPLAGPLVPRPAIGGELRDVRRKRPPALSFVLRMETLRRALRVATLLAVDFAGLFAAIFTALMVKAVLRYGEWAWAASLDEARGQAQAQGKQRLAAEQRRVEGPDRRA